MVKKQVESPFPAGHSGKLDTVRGILAEVELLRAVELSPPWQSFSVADVRGKSYAEMWDYCVTNNFFNFQLNDLSLLQFKWRRVGRERWASFSWLESPFLLPTFEEWTREHRDAFPPDEAASYYENFVMDDAKRKEAPVPIRYDYAPDEYKEGRHPASHLHVGVGGEIRLGTKKRFSAVTFTLLVIRQVYPDLWLRLTGTRTFRSVVAEVRSSLENVGPEYFRALDGYEHQLY